MIEYTNRDKEALNIKTGTKGTVLCEWNRVNDGQRIVECQVGRRRVFWKSENVLIKKN